MSVPDDLPEDRVSPLSAAWRAVKNWALSEVGGWIIVVVLALAIMLGLGVTFLRRDAALVQPPLPTSPTALTSSQAAQVDALTLAPDALQDMDFNAARAWNAGLPFVTGPNPAAKPFIAPADDPVNYGRALDCMTTAIYYEAGAETPAGQAAVAQVIINRSRHPAYPKSICGVVFQGSERATGCQFSFTCDGAMARVPSVEAWARARTIAMAALNGSVAPSVGMATHYHTDWVAPYWAPTLAKVVQIGTHIFYRWPGVWGRPAAFTGAYALVEPTVAKMEGRWSAAEIPEPVLPETVVDTPSLDIAPVMPSVPAAPVVETTHLTLDPIVVAPVAPSLADQAATRAVRAATAPIADPLANPATTQPRQRQRTPAPSRW